MHAENHKELKDWVADWWRSPERPSQIEKGQVWTVFATEADPEARGTIVCVFSKDGDYVYVIPLHNKLEAVTSCEPVIREGSLPYAPTLVAVVESGLFLSLKAFTTARFLGTFSRQNMDIIQDSFRKFRKIVRALTRLQIKEGEYYPEPVPDEELEKAFQAGILKLVSPDASMEEIVRLDTSMQENLRPFHLQAMASLNVMTESEKEIAPKDIEKYSVEDSVFFAQKVSIGESIEPWRKEGLDDRSRVFAEEPWKEESVIKSLMALHASKSFTAYSEGYGLDVGRGDTEARIQKKGMDQYAIGDRMVFCVEAPDNGHLVIFHCNQTGKVQLVFPHNSSDNTFVSGGSEKRIRGTVTKPSGKQLFKAIWTSRQLLEPGKVDFDDELEIEKTIVRFIHALAELGENDWQEVTYEFEAVEV